MKKKWWEETMIFIISEMKTLREKNIVIYIYIYIYIYTWERKRNVDCFIFSLQVVHSFNHATVTYTLFS